MFGTINKNKTEIPLELVNIAQRPIGSSQFAFYEDCMIASFVPKKKKMFCNTFRWQSWQENE